MALSDDLFYIKKEKAMKEKDKKKKVEIEKKEIKPGYRPNREKIVQPEFPPTEENIGLPHQKPIKKPKKPDTRYPKPNEFEKVY